MSTLIVGAAGAVGKRLATALAKRGDRVIASDRMPRLPAAIQKMAAACEPNVDVRDLDSLRHVMRKHKDIRCVWNLAAPLSVETALSPEVAEAVTIGGMENVLKAMSETGVRQICFTDSIGSFGHTAPRKDATAAWLVANPTQDPGSDYGLQKRGCRNLMTKFAKDHNGDPRFAVLPGVLHAEAVWGKGTTEYALEALEAAVNNKPYACPISPDVMLPMVYVEDLMRGLLALQDAEEHVLSQPQHGYCIPGLSFSANELFVEIRKHFPNFQAHVDLDENMDKFANLWPDTLSTAEPLRDLGYAPSFGLVEMVEIVLNGHFMRNQRTAEEFSRMDADGNNTIEKDELAVILEKILETADWGELELKVWGTPDRKNPKYLSTPRSRVVYASLINDLVDAAFSEMDSKKRGAISLEQFQTWSKTNSMTVLVDEFIKNKSTAMGCGLHGDRRWTTLGAP